MKPTGTFESQCGDILLLWLPAPALLLLDVPWLDLLSSLLQEAVRRLGVLMSFSSVFLKSTTSGLCGSQLIGINNWLHMRQASKKSSTLLAKHRMRRWLCIRLTLGNLKTILASSKSPSLQSSTESKIHPVSLPLCLWVFHYHSLPRTLTFQQPVGFHTKSTAKMGGKSSLQSSRADRKYRFKSIIWASWLVNCS